MEEAEVLRTVRTCYCQKEPTLDVGRRGATDADSGIAQLLSSPARASGRVCESQPPPSQGVWARTEPTLQGCCVV